MDAIEHLCNQAQKALSKLKQKCVQNHIESAFKLFDTLILPILSYCSEIWIPYFCKNLKNNNLFDLCEKLPIEKVHLKFCRYILGIHRKSTNAALRAELGRYPLLITLIGYSVKYWLKLCDYKKQTLVKNAYLDLYSSQSIFINWASSVKNILLHSDMSMVWSNQGSLYKYKIIKLLKDFFYNRYDTAWQEYLNREDSKLRTYKTFKHSIQLENYLLTTDINTRKEFTKLRISAHQLQIEMGRYSKPRKTPAKLMKGFVNYVNLVM